ncbi:MAG: DNA polymerase IV [Elusimicrobia bacterium]|nr:DNA polymerase IV [Elusimicrobiota bacterium]
MRTILHVDMNAYFASVEQGANPLLRGKPVAVVGDLTRRSVILTSSYEARTFGVKTGMLLHEARKLCPGLIPVEGRYEKYLDASDKILSVLTAFSDRVEMTSCDEAYLDVTETQKFWGDGEGTARRIQDRIGEGLGLPCSIGVAPNKLLAKLASDMKKPNGVTVIAPGAVPALLEKTPIEDLCGIGRHMKEHLSRLGVETCGQLGRMDFERLYRRFGAWGYWLKRMGQGKDDSPVLRVNDPDMVKSVGHSLTFPRNTWDAEVVKSYLMLLSEKVGARLRKYGLKGRTAALTLRYADFQTLSRHATAGEPTHDDVEIYYLGRRILNSLGPFPKAVRLIGVSVSRLVKDAWHGSLLESLEKQKKVAEVMDDINRKYGKRTVCRARVRLAEKHGVLGTPIPPGRRHA